MLSESGTCLRTTFSKRASENLTRTAASQAPTRIVLQAKRRPLKLLRVLTQLAVGLLRLSALLEVLEGVGRSRHRRLPRRVAQVLGELRPVEKAELGSAPIGSAIRRTQECYLRAFMPQDIAETLGRNILKKQFLDVRMVADPIGADSI